MQARARTHARTHVQDGDARTRLGLDHARAVQEIREEMQAALAAANRVGGYQYMSALRCKLHTKEWMTVDLYEDKDAEMRL